MEKVNLFIVGAAKSGTTALYNYLNKHPDIFMSPVKEPHFFADVKSSRSDKYKEVKEGEIYHSRIIKDGKKYHNLFKEGENYSYRGEASPSYLWDSNSAARIYQYNPNAKIIAILRDPIERAFSHFQMAFSLGRESKSDFFSAIKEDSLNPNGIWGKDPLYVELGFYHKHLKRYSTLFPKKNIKIIKSDYLRNNTRECLEELLNFLGLSKIDIGEKEITNTNKAKTVRFKWIRRLRNSVIHDITSLLIGEKLLSKMNKFFYKKSQDSGMKLDSKSISFLQNVYGDDLRKLKEEFDIEFSLKK